MTTSCRTDKHPRRAEIDIDMVAGLDYRSIINKYPEQKLSMGGLSRHVQCVKRDLGDAIKQRDGERLEHGGDLLKRVVRLVDDAESILTTAKSGKDIRAATSAVAALAKCLDLMGRATGELTAGGMSLHLTSNRSVTVNNSDGCSDLDLATAV